MCRARGRTAFPQKKAAGHVLGHASCIARNAIRLLARDRGGRGCSSPSFAAGSDPVASPPAREERRKASAQQHRMASERDGWPGSPLRHSSMSCCHSRPSRKLTTGACPIRGRPRFFRITTFESDMRRVLQQSAHTDPAIIATVVGETTTSKARARELRKIRPATFRTARPQLNRPELQLANPSVKGSRANSGSVVTIILQKTNTVGNGPRRSPGVLYEDCVSHDLTLHARCLLLQRFS